MHPAPASAAMSMDGTAVAAGGSTVHGLMCGVIGASNSGNCFQAFLNQRTVLFGRLRGFFQHVRGSVIWLSDGAC